MEPNNKKRQLDMLHGTIWDKLPRFALPVAATAILEQLFNASDIAIVGNFAGTAAEKTAAVAAVGANSAIIGLIVNLFVGIALGANVVIANAIGRDDRGSVHRAVHTAILISLLGGAAVAVIGELISGTILRALCVPQEVFPLALLYLRIYLLGMPVILLYNFEAAIFRSVGETKTPLIALACSGVLNVVLNLFFVAVLHMTVNGVAIATVISNALSSLILFIKLTRTDKYIKADARSLRIDPQSFKMIMKIGLPSGVQNAVFSLSNIVIQTAINSLGVVVMAASSAAFNIEILAYYVLVSFGQACTTFVGQNYGAKQIGRCRKTLIISLIEDAVASATAVCIILLSGRFILSIFNSDPTVIEIGYTRLIILFSAYPFSILCEVLSGYMRGFGISLMPAIITMLGVCGIRILWIRFVFPLMPTFKIILMSYPFSLLITAAMIAAALAYYRPARRLMNGQEAVPQSKKKTPEPIGGKNG